MLDRRGKDFKNLDSQVRKHSKLYTEKNDVVLLGEHLVNKFYCLFTG